MVEQEEEQGQEQEQGQKQGEEHKLPKKECIGRCKAWVVVAGIVASLVCVGLDCWTPFGNLDKPVRLIAGFFVGAVAGCVVALAIAVIYPHARNHWHGAVQTVVIAVALGVCVAFIYWKTSINLQTCDFILILGTIVALAIGIICSHAYNYIPGSETDPLRDIATKKQSIWLHANFSWNTISIWMTVTSLYCTCATIYISGSSLEEAWAQDHIIIYSVLSLVLSLGVYVLRPSNRATGYRKAYLVVTKALVDDNSSDQQNLKEAIIKGEEIIAKQDVFSPG